MNEKNRLRNLKMKKYFIILLAFFCMGTYAQSYDEDKMILSNFVERLYNNAPFEGCRIIDDYDHSYLLSVVLLAKTKYKVPSAMNRIAQVKSQRNAGEFLNGTQSYSEFIIKTPKCEKGDSTDMTETIEVIKSSSTGFVQQMQLLTTFDSSENFKVYVFYKQIK